MDRDIESVISSEQKEAEGETVELSEDNHDTLGDEKIKLFSALTSSQDYTEQLLSKQDHPLKCQDGTDNFPGVCVCSGVGPGHLRTQHGEHGEE